MTTLGGERKWGQNGKSLVYRHEALHPWPHPPRQELEPPGGLTLTPQVLRERRYLMNLQAITDVQCKLQSTLRAVNDHLKEKRSGARRRRRSSKLFLLWKCNSHTLLKLRPWPWMASPAMEASSLMSPKQPPVAVIRVASQNRHWRGYTRGVFSHSHGGAPQGCGRTHQGETFCTSSCCCYRSWCPWGGVSSRCLRGFSTLNPCVLVLWFLLRSSFLLVAFITRGTLYSQLFGKDIMAWQIYIYELFMICSP